MAEESSLRSDKVTTRSKKLDGSKSAEVDTHALFDLESLIGFELRRSYYASARKFVEILGGLAIQPGQYSLLLAIERRPNETQTSIARLLSIDRSTMVPLLDQLERKGFVERVRNLQDRRAHALRLTRAGAEILKKSRGMIAQHEGILTKGLSAAEQKVLLQSLQRLRANCE